MTNEQRIKNLEVPEGMVDVILDTDAFNEVDDQFAIAYLLKSQDKLNIKGIYAAPFFNAKVSSPAEGMEQSYDEIFHVLELAGESKPVFKGSAEFLPDEKTPVDSEAARDLAQRVKGYSPENPLYVVAIGAITNIASAILMNPMVAENTVVVWLGGHAQHLHDTKEFNMMQDIAAARIVFKSGVPLVQLPCAGVVSEFKISKPELERWFVGVSPLADYLALNTIEHAESAVKIPTWSRVLWDITAVAWLLNDNGKYMLSRIITAPIPSYDYLYSANPNGHPMRYVYYINRDLLMNDVVEKLGKN